jgi:hypothetical protein
MHYITSIENAHPSEGPDMVGHVSVAIAGGSPLSLTI